MALSVVEALILGIMQGATEWLPVSSSGHLTIARESLGVEVPVAFDLLLHLATLGVVIGVFRHRLWTIARAFLQRDWNSPDARLGWMLVLGTVPIAIAGLLFESQIEAAFTDLRVVGWSLLWTATVLASTFRARHDRPLSSIKPRDALWVGAFQAIALLPGVSRSGMTMAAGFHRGFERDAAADYAFLLAVPALLAATVLKAPEAPGLIALGWVPLVVGTVAAAIVGWLTLSMLRIWVRRWGLLPFAGYCAVVGAVILAMT